MHPAPGNPMHRKTTGKGGEKMGGPAVSPRSRPPVPLGPRSRSLLALSVFHPAAVGPQIPLKALSTGWLPEVT